MSKEEREYYEMVIETLREIREHVSSMLKRWIMIYLELVDLKTMKIFKKFFDTEWERDKFARKLRYSKKLKVVGGNYETF